MRLLHTRELRFEEFFDDIIPMYSTLSHRWTDEVSYHEFLYLSRSEWQGGTVLAPMMVIDDARKDSAGFRKIMDFRNLASLKGYLWIWADTVCIDKSSSAELSEAINSMYEWYKDAAICIVYLSDVSVTASTTAGTMPNA